MQIGHLSYLFFFLTVLAGCSHQTGGNGIIVDGPLPSEYISIFLTSERRGEIEPCGCSMGLLGGIVRELNFLSSARKARTRKSVLLFAAGRTFVPDPPIPESLGEAKAAASKPALTESVILKRSEFLVDAMNKLGYTAVGISLQDFPAGIANLETLSKRAKFPFLNLNLHRKEGGGFLFLPALRLHGKGIEIVVIGISAAPAVSSKFPEGLSYVPSERAIEDYLKTLDPKPRVIIVLSDYSEVERRKLFNQFPEIQLILGGPEKEEASPEQVSPNQLYLNPSSKGKSVAYIEFLLSGSVSHFFNSEIVNANVSYREGLAATLQKLAIRVKKLRGKKNHRADVADIEKQQVELKELLYQSSNIPGQITPASTQYTGGSRNLDKEWDVPPNALSDLVARFKKWNEGKDPTH